MTATGRRRAWALITGGGTGGHVVPAIAIGQALVARGHAIGTIHFVGSSRGLERRMVPESRLRGDSAPRPGYRPPACTIDNVGAAAGLAAALVRALILVGRLRPAVIVSVGGYASVTGALAAVAWRVPLVVAEQNAVPGLANRLVGRFAAVCAVLASPAPAPAALGGHRQSGPSPGTECRPFGCVWSGRGPGPRWDCPLRGS